MDLSNAGVTEQVDGAFRAHVQRSDKGSTGRHIHGPRRPNEEAAKEDLESMRAAASGMGREDGFAAMKAEADELKAGKLPKEVGVIDRDSNGFRAHVHFSEKGSQQNIYGPWRPDEEAAKGDLQSMRAAAISTSREDGFAAMHAEANSNRAIINTWACQNPR